MAIAHSSASSSTESRSRRQLRLQKYHQVNGRSTVSNPNDSNEESETEADGCTIKDPVSENMIKLIGFLQLIAGTTLITTGFISCHLTKNQLVGIISFLSGGSSVLAGFLELNYYKSANDTVILRGAKSTKEVRRKLALFMFKSFTILIICFILSVINLIVIYREDLLQWS